MFFFEQKTAYEMRISDWSSDVCSSDLRFLIEKTRLLDRLRGRINARQEKALIRMMTEGPDGFVGGLSAHNYRTITDAASATATRDLAELVELGALERAGDRRYARYHLAIATNARGDRKSTRLDSSH